MEKMSFVLSKDFVARAPVRLSLLSEVRYFRNFTVLIALLYCVRLNKLLEFLQK